MAALALVGITGMYLNQIRKHGLLGLIGYVVFAAGYLGIMCIAFTAAYVLPEVASSNPGFVNDAIAVNTGRGTVHGDIGAFETMIKVRGFAYLVGSLLFGVALYRAHVLTRWAAALLAVAGLATAGSGDDARRPLPPPGLPQRHRDDRPGLLAVEGRPRRRRTRSTAVAVDTAVQSPQPSTAGVVE